MTNEIWKSINSYENSYEISNLGNIRSITRKVNSKGNSLAVKKGYVLNFTISIHGYKRVTLCKNGKRKQFFIHRLIANAFIKNIHNKPQVNHIDGNKLNNDLSNLEWCTHSENMQHAYNIGLKIPPRNRLGFSGYLHPQSKTVLQMDLNNVIINEYGSINITKFSGFTPQHVHKCCQGKLKTHKKFKWRYKN